jgi:acyl dehydratase
MDLVQIIYDFFGEIWGGEMAKREIAGIAELHELVGQEVAVGDWLEITQERINAFADATSDHQWIHVDVERCRTESPFGTTIAHGFLTLSLLPKFSYETVGIREAFKMTINYGLNKLRFPNPVRCGSRVRARFLLQETAGRVYKPMARNDWLPGAIFASAAVTAGWGILVYGGTIGTIWPMFGIANQILAVLALALVWSGARTRAREQSHGIEV